MVEAVIDHRSFAARLAHARKGESGATKVNVRPLTAGLGLKLDISSGR